MTQTSIDGINIADPVSIDEAFLQAEEYEGVVIAVMQLPAREQEIILRRYWNGETLTHIAETFGLSLSRISQMHKSAIGHLREALTV